MIDLRQKLKEENLKFIEENELVEHPRFKGYYGTKESRVFSFFIKIYYFFKP
tara:strand:+ start:463 stop:618 length:156 start_codon:yes stop_codon:yes gene_type:complete